MKFGWVLAALTVTAAVLLAVRHKIYPNPSKEDPMAREEWLENAKKFSGRYQSLAKAIGAGNRHLAQKHMDVWRDQAGELCNLRRFLDSLCAEKPDPLDAAAALLRTLEHWGVQHHVLDDVFTITREQEALYLFDDAYEPGEQARVVRPAWWIQTEERLVCIETGAAEIVYQE